eukprot:scaffold2191_cov392-Prasinococcus_capsulatus_cf.AAC.4
MHAYGSPLYPIVSVSGSSIWRRGTTGVPLYLMENFWRVTHGCLVQAILLNQTVKVPLWRRSSVRWSQP